MAAGEGPRDSVAASRGPSQLPPSAGTNTTPATPASESPGPATVVARAEELRLAQPGNNKTAVAASAGPRIRRAGSIVPNIWRNMRQGSNFGETNSRRAALEVGRRRHASRRRTQRARRDKRLSHRDG